MDILHRPLIAIAWLIWCQVAVQVMVRLIIKCQKWPISWFRSPEYEYIKISDSEIGIHLPQDRHTLYVFLILIYAQRISFQVMPKNLSTDLGKSHKNWYIAWTPGNLDCQSGYYRAQWKNETRSTNTPIKTGGLIWWTMSKTNYSTVIDRKAREITDYNALYQRLYWATSRKDICQRWRGRKIWVCPNGVPLGLCHRDTAHFSLCVSADADGRK